MRKKPFERRAKPSNDDPYLSSEESEEMQPELNEKSEDYELSLAVAALLEDYQLDVELTAFTSLDGEDLRHA